MQILQKLESIIINSAVGDALGAGYEIIKADALPQFDAKLPFIKSDNGEPGSVTDDTSMSVAGMVGIIRALQKIKNQPRPNIKMLVAEVLQQTHLAYMQWAENQITHSGEFAEAIPAYLKTADVKPFPEKLAPLLHTKGPGGSTLKSLNQLAEGKCGLGEAPKHFAPGCGGMMRISPFALLSAISKGTINAFEIGRETAKLTHPAPSESTIASGVVCELIADGLAERPANLLAALHNIKQKYLSFSREDNEELRTAKALTLLAIDISQEAAMEGYSRQAADDAVGLFFQRANVSGFNNPVYKEMDSGSFFFALPVLVQSLYVLLQREKNLWPVDETIAAAVLHSGDSDSVGAIVGNIIGARSGEKSSRFNELNQQHRESISYAIDIFSQSLQQASRWLGNLRSGQNIIA